MEESRVKVFGENRGTKRTVDPDLGLYVNPTSSLISHTRFLVCLWDCPRTPGVTNLRPIFIFLILRLTEKLYVYLK